MIIFAQEGGRSHSVGSLWLGFHAGFEPGIKAPPGRFGTTIDPFVSIGAALVRPRHFADVHGGRTSVFDWLVRNTCTVRLAGYEEQEFTEKPEDGVYTYGLFFEACRWEPWTGRPASM